MIDKNNLSAILEKEIETIIPLEGGANNRVYKIIFDKSHPLILKKYFSHSSDKRNRLEAEYCFLKYTEKKEITNVPKPILQIEKENIGIYSYIEGGNFKNLQIKKCYIDQAINFFISLNNDNHSSFLKLPFASEACLSINDYFLHVEKRIEKFKILILKKELPSLVINYLNSSLLPKWNLVKKITLQKISKENIDRHKKCSIKSLCVTPSDFGLHNALLSQNKKVYFIDFEYAGIDDPVKTICDFFLQPKYKIPIKYLNHFLEKISISFDSNKLEKKINLLMPICSIKWCFILLNIFLCDGKKRRKFSKTEENDFMQMQKSEILLNQIEI